MHYKQLTEKNKVEIDILLKQNLSMREVARRLGISHSTISRYKSGIYKKRKIDINKKYEIFIKYLFDHYDRRDHSIEVCVYRFKKQYPWAKCVSVKQVYNWIEQGKIFLERKDLCYKKHKKKKRSGMMEHFLWNLENKTILPISLRPKYIEERNEPGHLEIDSILGKKDEQQAIISIVDRCTRRLWLIKAEYRYDYYTANLIYKYIIKNDIDVKSITVDNGLEFKALGIAAKRLGVKLYKCDPYCSFQRGTNERMNALVRRFLPKGKSFIQVGQQYLEDISFKINSMPRKIFDFKTPYEIDFIHIKNGAVEI
jgi:IS30 family transposase